MSSIRPRIRKQYTIPALEVATIFSRGPNYATARQGTGTKEIRVDPYDYASVQGATSAGPLYTVAQFFVRFDNSLLTVALNDPQGGTVESIYFEIKSVAAYFPGGLPGGLFDEYTLAFAPDKSFPLTEASFVPGTNLPTFVAGRYTVVRAQDFNVTSNRITVGMSLDKTAVINGNILNGEFVLFMERQRDNQGPAHTNTWIEGVLLPYTLNWLNPENLRMVVTIRPAPIPGTDLSCIETNTTTYNQFNTMALTWTILPGSGVNPNGCRLVLYTTTPTRAAEGTRPGGGYADTDVPVSYPSAPPSNNVVASSAIVAFPMATADWTGLTHWGLVGRNASELLMFGPLDGAPLTVRSSEYASVNTGELVVSLNGAFPETNNKVARVVFERIAPATLWADYGSSPRTMYIALIGQSGIELAGGAYTRQTDTFSQVGNYAVNDSLITFPTASATWTAIHYVAIYDPTNTECRFVVKLDTPRIVENGYTFSIPVGALKVGWI